MNGAFPVSTTKITVPALRPEILHRARLLDLLDALLDKRLALVTAPAGYGKTSLLVEMARSSAMPFCWLALDALDQEPQRFLSYFIASIAHRFPKFGNLSNAALRHLRSFEDGDENLLVTLVNEIYERIDEHFVIVLDDYQFVDNVPEIRGFVSRFLQLAGENCHVVLASRRLPALADLPALVARQQVGGFDLEELAFRPEEIRLLCEKNYGVGLSDEEVDTLAHRTEGWITGLLLAGTAPGAPDPRRAVRASGVDLDAYFDQQVFAPQPPAVQEFLLQTSLLEEFDAALCDAVLGVGEWGSMMEAVRRGNLFVLSVGPDNQWLRYHQLFRDFLQARLKAKSPQTAQAILSRLARVSEENGDWERAFHIYRQNGDAEALAGLVERAGTPLIQNDKFITLGNWLDSLPEALIRQRPGLLSLRGVTLLVRGKAGQSLPLFDEAISAFRIRSDAPGLALALVRRGAAHRLSGDYAVSLADADEALNIPAKSDEMLEYHAEACHLKGWALLRLGQPSQALAWAERSLALYTQLDAARSIPIALSNLGIIRRAMGDTSAACEAYEKAYALCKQQGNLTMLAGLGNSLGVLYHSLGEYETAVQYFEEGLKSARRSGYLRNEALILASLGDLYIEIGDHEASAQAFEKVETFARQYNDHFLLHYALLARAGLARLAGTFDRARTLLEDARAEAGSRASNYEQGLYELERGRLDLATGDPAGAVSGLQAALASFGTGGLVLETGWTRLWLAAACAASGDRDAARACLEAVEELLTRGASLHSLGMMAYHVRERLEAVEAGQRSGLKRLLEAAAPTQAKLPRLRKHLRRMTSAVPLPSPRLVIRAFGKGQVRVGGQAVTNERWKTRSVRELFFFLLNTPDAVTKEQICAQFWPDDPPARVRQRFKNDLYRLRSALGADAVQFDGERYRFNSATDYEYDVETFEDCLRRAGRLADNAEKIRLVAEAAELARGPFLEDMDSEWIEPERERLRQALLPALLTLAELHLQRGDKDSAIKTCQRALAVDRYLEEAHRLAMRVYARQGDRAAVSHQYQACRHAIETDLGMSLSAETEALYRELTS
jgi:LuxR family maltose regulon positive regulatory protein